MKYTDNDRLVKILSKGKELTAYLSDNNVTRDELPIFLHQVEQLINQ